MTKPLLILADDDANFRAVLQIVLTDAGYEVLTAANGIEALRLCETPKVAAAIVDLVMPVKEGLETIFEMRRRFPHIKTVAISGGGRGPGDTYLQMARQLGAATALAKPFSNAELLDAIQKVLDPGAPPEPLRAP